MEYLTLYLFRRYLYTGNVQVMKTEFIAAISRVGVALIRSTRGEYLCCLVVVLLLLFLLWIRIILYENMIWWGSLIKKLFLFLWVNLWFPMMLCIQDLYFKANCLKWFDFEGVMPQYWIYEILYYSDFAYKTLGNIGVLQSTHTMYRSTHVTNFSSL